MWDYFYVFMHAGDVGHMERLICALKEDRPSSLKAAGYLAHFFSLANHLKNDLISAIHQKSYNS